MIFDPAFFVSKIARFIGGNSKAERNIDKSRKKENGSDTIEASTDAFLPLFGHGDAIETGKKQRRSK